MTVNELAEDLWQHALQTQPYYALRAGRPIARLRAETLEDADADRAFGRQLRESLATLKQEAVAMSDAERLTAEFLEYECDRLEESPECWWTAFPYTPYNAQTIAFHAQVVLPAQGFTASEDVDRYLLLLGDLANLIRAQTARLEAQAKRGWRIPAPALSGARAAIEGIGRSVATRVRVADDRTRALRDVDRSHLAEGTSSLLLAQVLPALEAARAALGSSYEHAAPPGVGLAQYPGGEAAYELWIRHHMTCDLSAVDVHALGENEVARLTDAMAELRATLGFDGDEVAFAGKLRAAGRMHANSPQDLEARYRRWIERIQPRLAQYFWRVPRAPYDIQRLDPGAEPGMTYGYYEPPNAARPKGLYRYNGSGLETRVQVAGAALIYHELVPGHHFHLARQSESDSLPSIRRHCLDISVFNEGWAEYASGLAGEMGLYDDPYDAYGRLLHERFTAQRLVVDTGLNALGWSLEQASAYMKRYTLESPEQVATETLRYSTDLPGQALAYRIGYLKIMELREGMRSDLGPRFDLRDFHETVLAEGALPLPVLERHVARATERLRNEDVAGRYAGTNPSDAVPNGS